MTKEVSTLDSDQVKAFNSLKRAINKCEKANIKFYTVLDTMFSLNGNDVLSVGEDEEHDLSGVLDLSYSIDNNGFCSFADDTHRVTFK